MAQLRLLVLGPPRLERAGQPIDLALRRALALLVYLAVSRQPQSRDALATLLWPDSDQREARTNLRRTLHRLTQAVGDDILTTSGDTVAILPDAPLWVDSHAFLRLAGQRATASAHPASGAGLAPASDGKRSAQGGTASLTPASDSERSSGEGLEQAVALYADDFLAGFTLPDSPAFDEWQFYERERLRQLLAQALERLVELARVRGDWDAATSYARRWVALDLLHEPAQRALLGAYAQTGQAAAAQRQYQELARVLEAELGAEPEEATRALYEAIRTRRFPPAAPPAGTENPAATPAQPDQPPPARPLIGRERELADLLGLLGDQTGPRLVTLTGPGGIGKTHLAQAVAAAAAERFAHGAHLIALAEIAEPGGIMPAIAARLELSSAAGDAAELLPRLLRGRELLLVLDNFEHLLAGAPAVSATLAAAPGVRVLATSRERLSVSGELVYTLGGLALPDEGGADRVLEAPAAQLLIQQARLVRQELDPDAGERAAIARLCRLVQGMPLALTLAASWAELLSFAEIADEVARSLDFLATEQLGVPERQRSVRAVFEGSWRRLPAEAQRIFVQLAAFRGGFTRPAAEAVAGADLRALRQLVNSSFITVSGQAQRYAIHELLRQHVAERLADPAALAAARDRHSGYYLDLLQQLSADLRSPRQQAAIATIAADFDNVQGAWEWAAAHGRRDLLAGAAEALWIFCDRRSHLREARELYASAAAGVSPDSGALHGFLLVAQGYFTARCDPLGHGWELMERGLGLLRASAAPRPLWQSLALLHMALVARTQGRFAEAERMAEESLALFADADDRWGVTYSLLLLGLVIAYKGRPVLAGQLLQASHERAHEIGDRGVASLAASSLAISLSLLGDYPRAQRYLDVALRDAEAVGDPLSTAVALHERGMLALACGDSTQAAWSFQACSEAFAMTGSGYTASLAQPTAELAGMLRGDPASAEAVEQRALASIQAPIERLSVVRYLHLVGRLARGRGDLSQAEQLQRAALSLAQRIEQEPYIAAAACQLADVLAAHEGASGEARRLLVLALELAVRHQLAPVALQATVTAVRLRLEDERLPQDHELLALVQDHPAATFACREQARELTAQLGSGQPERRAAGLGHADWRSLAEQLRRALGEPGAPPHAPATNLDLRLPPLIGRELELAQLIGLLNLPSRRLVTLHGPGGIGKTRLAQEAGLAALDTFPDGAFFVSLAPVTEPAQIPAAIAEQLGMRPSGAGEPRDQLLTYLRAKQLLLVLDNFEQLGDGAELIAAILHAAPKVTVLVTSRERLGLDGEVVYTLGGIEFPEGEGDERAMERGAMQLLLERIRQVRPAFNPGPAELDAMIQICQLVQGMPLAIILAASWADLLALGEITAEIERSLGFLEADLRALAPRQRSVRAVFEASWRRLQPNAQHVFARMAVFRGGCSRQAAEAVAGADLRTLRALVNSAFIVLDGDDCYSIHELLRQFGAEHLAALGEAEVMLDRHSGYYLEALAAREPDLKGRRQLEAFQAIERDLANIRQAWAHALERGDGQLVRRALDTVFEFGEKRGRFREGADMLEQARRRLAPTPKGGALWQPLTSRLSILRSRFPREHQVPLPELEHSLAAARAAGDPAEEALACLALGVYYARTENDYARLVEHAERAYAIHTSLGDRFYLAEDLARIGIAYGYLGDTQAFYQRCHEGYAIAEADGNRIGMAITLMNLTEALLHLGRYDAMVSSSEHLVSIAEPLGMRNAVNTALAYSALGHLLRGDLAEARRLALAGHRISIEMSSALSAGLSLGILSLQAGIGGDDALGARFAEESLAHPLNLIAAVETYWGLALAQCGLGRNAEAERSLRAALAAAGRFATPVPTVWLLPILAVLLERQGRPAQAAAVLALASTHPLSATGWMERWRLLAELRAGLERELGGAAFAAAWEHGAQLEVAAAIALLDQDDQKRSAEVGRA